MKKQEVFRNYNFSDASLVLIGKEKVAYMRRDVEEFDKYGISRRMIADLETELTDFSEYTTDVEMLGDQTEVTEAKNSVADKLRVAIRSVMSRVELKHGADSARYRKFGTAGLSKLTDAELLIVGKRVVRVGAGILTAMSEEGTKPEILSEIRDLCHEFEDRILEMHEKIGDRDIVQEDRVEAGNAIYSTLVSYTGTGRLMWETKDVAKYNDYIIYDSHSNHASGSQTPPKEV